MKLFFILLLLPLKLTSGYHDDDLFAGNRYYEDDEEYWSDNYDFYNDFSGDGEFYQTVSVENLRRDLFTNYSKNIISSCGSGVTACVLAFALELIGKKNWQVYDGSWSEWGLNKENMIET